MIEELKSLAGEGTILDAAVLFAGEVVPEDPETADIFLSQILPPLIANHVARLIKNHGYIEPFPRVCSDR